MPRRAAPSWCVARPSVCLQTDALGYDAETQDPLYKHAPFVIADGAAGGGTIAVGNVFERVAMYMLPLTLTLSP